MNQVKIADLKNNLSRHLARVRQGGEITVVDRDTPVARIIPFLHHAQPNRAASSRRQAKSTERLADLARQGVLSPGDSLALDRWLNDHPPVRRPAGSPSAVAALLEMRRKSTR